MNLDMQIQNIQNIIQNNDTDYLQVLNKIIKINLVKDYLPLSTSHDILQRANEICNSYDALEKSLNEDRDKLKYLSKQLATLRKPMLFGKSNYESNKQNMEHEVKCLESDINTKENKMSSLNNEYKEYLIILTKHNDEAKKNDKLYIDDEQKFNGKKTELIKTVLNDFLQFPPSIIKGDWDNSMEWIKDFIKKDPKTNLIHKLPAECLSHLLPVIFTSAINLESWIADDMVIIVNGKENKMRDLLIEILNDYVDKANNVLSDDYFYCYIKARLYHTRSVMSLSSQQVSAIEAANQYYELEEQAISQIEEAYHSIDKGKQFALKDSDENMLNIFNNLKNSMEMFWRKNIDGKFHEVGTHYGTIYTLDEINSGVAFEKVNKWHKIYKIGENQYILAQKGFSAPNCGIYVKTGKIDYSGDLRFI